MTTRQERADRIGVMLDELYPDPPIPLDHRDGFTLLVAVLLSAQTTDARVNLVTPALFDAAPTATAMAKLSADEILELIKTCGLAPTKAKNLHRLANILVDDHDGEIPEALEELEKLPGVGHKTASVVMTQWFGEPAFPVDTHIHRLARRWDLSSGKNVETTEDDLKKVFPKDTWNRRHLQIIYFGREHCPALRHDFDACPVCSWASTTKTRALEAKDAASKAKDAKAKDAKAKAPKSKAAPKPKAAKK